MHPRCCSMRRRASDDVSIDSNGRPGLCFWIQNARTHSSLYQRLIQPCHTHTHPNTHTPKTNTNQHDPARHRRIALAALDVVVVDVSSSFGWRRRLFWGPHHPPVSAARVSSKLRSSYHIRPGAEASRTAPREPHVFVDRTIIAEQPPFSLSLALSLSLPPDASSARLQRRRIFEVREGGIRGHLWVAKGEKECRVARASPAPLASESAAQRAAVARIGASARRTDRKLTRHPPNTSTDRHRT